MAVARFPIGSQPSAPATIAMRPGAVCAKAAIESPISLKCGFPMSQKSVFLDRDGVINKIVYRDGKPTSPRNIEEFEFEEGVEAALSRLDAQGFKLFVVTNQPELARGLLTKESLCVMTERILSLLKIEEVRICPHDNDDDCRCRKPQPGMLVELAHKYELSLKESYIVGDNWKDSCAGRSAGCKSIILNRSYNLEDPADWRVPDLGGAVDLICASQR
jgi:D-glycero-D-manno-heptose 1,7-bisphosphate phosphatase